MVDKTIMKRKRAKTSPIWATSKENLSGLVAKADTFSEVLKELSMRPIGGNHRTLRSRLDAESICYTHIKLGQGSNKGKKLKMHERRPLQEMIVINSDASRSTVKRRIIDEHLIENKCALCKMLPKWNGQSLTLVLDHVNGIHNDHRLENLRLLCPNCNSQTDTFAGRRGQYRTE